MKRITIAIVRFAQSQTQLPTTSLLFPQMVLSLKLGFGVRESSVYKAHEKSKFMQKLIYKRGAKTKRNWYKPHLGESLEVEAKKTKKGISHGHGIRLRQLSHVLYDKITDIINTGELSQDILENQVSITAVKINRDMNNANVYWDADRSDWKAVEQLLMTHSGKLRSLLISYHVLGRIPHIVFVKDKSGVNLSQMAQLFDKADYGPDYVPGLMHSSDGLDDLEQVQVGLDNISLQKSNDLNELGEDDYGFGNGIECNLSTNNSKLNKDEKTLRNCKLQNNSAKPNSEINIDGNLHFRSDLYGLDRDEMMKKILAKRSKSNITTDIVDNNIKMPSLEFDVNPKGVPSLVSPVMTKIHLKQKLARQERKILQKLLERDSVEL